MTFIFFSSFLTAFIIVFSTVLHRLNVWKTLLTIFKPSTIRENWQKLVSTQTNSNDIACIHGIRFFSMMLIIWNHKAMEVYMIPLSNRNTFALLHKSFLANLFRPSILLTDLFFTLSALLTSYMLISRLKQGKKVQVWREVATRYFRFIPLMAVVMFLDAFVLPIIANGPLWGIFIENPAQRCKTFWWRNFLMIQNWFGIENVCVVQSYHIALDFQLSIAGILLSIFLVKHPKRAQIVILILAILATLARFYVSYSREVSIYLHFGTR
jgi:hypothetical protein